MTLIAEDLLLLLLDDEKGTVSGTSHLGIALGGALLVELALAGAVEVPEKTSVWRTAKVSVVEGVAVDDPLLERALGVVRDKQRSAEDLVNRLGKHLKDDLTARLEARGILRREESRVLGLIPRTRWPATDSSHEDAVHRDLTAVLVEGVDPDPRVAGLVALLSVIDAAHKVVDHRGLGKGPIKKRAKEIAQGDWAAKAVRDAVWAATAAITAATAATAVAAGSG